jgi:hypothetical protein
MTVRSDDRALLIAILIVAAAAFTAQGSVFTADWLSCAQNKGGITCREPRNMAAGAFGALGLTALTLVTNTRR